MESTSSLSYCMLGSTVEFTNSAGRKIVGQVTLLDKGWATVVETVGSAYKLPAATLKVVKSTTKTGTDVN